MSSCIQRNLHGEPEQRSLQYREVAVGWQQPVVVLRRYAAYQLAALTVMDLRGCTATLQAFIS